MNVVPPQDKDDLQPTPSAVLPSARRGRRSTHEKGEHADEHLDEAEREARCSAGGFTSVFVVALLKRGRPWR